MVCEAGLRTEKRLRSLVHIPFCYTTQSTADSFSAQVASPQTLAIQTCSRSCGVLLGLKTVWQLHSREENKRTSFSLHAEFQRG